MFYSGEIIVNCLGHGAKPVRQARSWIAFTLGGVEVGQSHCIGFGQSTLSLSVLAKALFPINPNFLRCP